MKKIMSILLVLVLLLSLNVTAFAEHLKGESGWKVTLTSAGKMESNFKTSAADDYMKGRGIQPGDDITFTVSLSNAYKDTTDWYMKNDIIRSLEDQSANKDTAGGAYSYKLVYKGPDKEKVLYDSDVVGGEMSDKVKEQAGEGLHEATGALKNYFYLDTLKSGQGGTVTLTVALDGESQGNDYQDTLADLNMRFAVELKDKPTVVKTGDDTNLMPAYIVMAVSGLLFLTLALDGVRQRRKEARR